MSGRTSPLLDNLICGLEGWDYEVTSEISVEYNCIAFAAGEEDRFWWPRSAPHAFWPEGARDEETIEAFVEAYATIGYEQIDDESFDPAHEKVALYLSKDGLPRHAAKQIDDWYWQSKLGNYHDIKHPLRALAEEYGDRFIFLRRRRRP
jgi:hypothetical protein